MWTRFIQVSVMAVLMTGAVTAQEENARERALVPYRAGLEHMRAGTFGDAAQSFGAAVSKDPTFELAEYMLGRAHLALKEYSEAIGALSRSRTLYLARDTRDFSFRREREEKLLQQLEEYAFFTGVVLTHDSETDKRMWLDGRQVARTDWVVPPFVSLSLGSAHFRAGNLAEAETYWKEAIATDRNTAEAHNNLAALYLQTARYEDAEKAVRNAEAAGFVVQPALTDQIRQRQKPGTE